jgi:hypothetical protein
MAAAVAMQAGYMSGVIACKARTASDSVAESPAAKTEALKDHMRLLL